MTSLPSPLIDLLREANAALAAGRDALLHGHIDAVASLSRDAETLVDRLSKALPDGLSPAQLRDPEIAGLLTEMRRLGRGNTLIAGEMLRHFRAALTSLRRTESDRLYNRDGGEAPLAAQRILGLA
jgi:hypothetical protein